MSVLALIIVLGVLIFVHELGHFAAAKAVGIGVERFSIGLGPKVAGFTWGETEYVISAIPLGGYVKMVGMDDEVMERLEGITPEERRQPSDRDYDSKPVWARMIVITAGVFMNMLFAFAAYTVVAAFWGQGSIPSTRTDVVMADRLPAGAEALVEVPAGAYFSRVGDVEVEKWNDVAEALRDAEAGPLTFAFEEPALEVTVELSASLEERARLWAAFPYWRAPVLGVVDKGSPADEGDLRVGDRILSIEGQPVESWGQLTALVQPRAGERTEFVLERDGLELTRYATPEPVDDTDPVTGVERVVGRVGITHEEPEILYERVSLSDAVVAGWRDTEFATRMILGFLRDLVTGQVSPRSVGSIVTIGQASGQAASMGVAYFLQFMALFSVNLAILNLLPIPVLDGGHLVFLTIEAVRGKALSAEQRLKWSNVGFIVIMGIMVWALGNDLLRLVGL